MPATTTWCGGRFENIRIEPIERGQLVNLRVWYNEKYCTAPGRGIGDVLFKNITYTGPDPEVSVLEGYSPDRAVRNVRLENLNVNGTVIADDMEGNWGIQDGGHGALFCGQPRRERPLREVTTVGSWRLANIGARLFTKSRAPNVWAGSAGAEADCACA